MQAIQYRNLFRAWEEFTKALDHKILDVEFKGSVHDAYYKSIEAVIGDDNRWEWIGWWVLDNNFGKNGLTGSQSFGPEYAEKMKIKTQDDLIAVLVRMGNE